MGSQEHDTVELHPLESISVSRPTSTEITQEDQQDHRATKTGTERDPWTSVQQLKEYLLWQSERRQSLRVFLWSCLAFWSKPRLEGQSSKLQNLADVLPDPHVCVWNINKGLMDLKTEKLVYNSDPEFRDRRKFTNLLRLSLKLTYSTHSEQNS